MTVSTSANRADYTGNGSTTAFPVPFLFLDAAHLKVLSTVIATGASSTLVLNSDYTVTGTGLAAGGTVTTTAAPAVGTKIAILLSMPFLQGTHYVPNDPFPAASHEAALDYVTLLVKQSAEQSSRSIQFPAGEAGSNPLVPPLVSRAGLLFGWDGNGQPAAVTGPIVSSPVIATAKRELQTASVAQTAFTLTTMSYASATPASVLVVVDGLVLPQSEYTQTSPTVVTLNTALLGGEQVEFIAGNFTSLSSGSFAAAHTTSGATDVGSFQFRRNVEYAGGTPGFVNSAVRIDTYVDNAAATAFEWGLTSVIQNKATAGQNVAIYGQGNKLSGAGPTWGGVIECIDYSGGNPTTGSVTLELDVRGNGADTNKARIGIDIAATVLDSAAPGTTMHASYGIRFQTNNNPNVTFDNLIGCAPGINAGLGIDLSPATITGAAIKLANVQAIQFDTSVLQSNTDNGLDHSYGGTLQNRLLKTGGLQVHSVKVVGDRQGGWALPTGTLSRATFDQSTVTLPLLAQRVAALITDLTTHGLIGA